MGCCDGNDVRSLLPELGELPESTIGCMAKMAYFMLCSAEYFYTGRGLTPWEQLLEAERMSYQAKAREALRGARSHAAPTDILFYSLLRGLTTAI